MAMVELKIDAQSLEKVKNFNLKVKKLIEQIETSDYKDSEGHDLKSNDCYNQVKNWEFLEG